MANGKGADDERRSESLKTEYQQVCSHFSLLTDIRFKLLALLPVGTGAGVALAEAGGRPPQAALIGLFGLAVTCAIALYNMRNDQLYNALVARAAELERRLGLKDGAFAHRPRAWLRVGRVEVNHGKIWWIYGASLAAWLFLVLQGAVALIVPEMARPMEQAPAGAPPRLVLIEAAVAIAIVLLLMRMVRDTDREKRQALRTAARQAVEILKAIPLARAPELGPWRPYLEQVPILAGKDDLRNDKAQEYRTALERALLVYLGDTDCFYWDRPPDGERCDTRAAAQLTGLLSDMPPRWIYDVASGRRGVG